MILTYHEITQLNDPLLMPWLDGIQKNFPPNEQMLASFFLDLLHKKQAEVPQAANKKLLAVLDNSSNFLGCLMYELLVERKACYLWYIVVDPAYRAKGLGSSMYQDMVEQAKQHIADLEAVIFEVDRPDKAENDEERITSEKRLRFYRRLGALVAANIIYYQSVGSWQPEKMMYLCVHPLKKISDSNAYTLLESEFGETMTPVDHIVLE